MIRTIAGKLTQLTFCVALLSGCSNFLPWSAPIPNSFLAVRPDPAGRVEALLVPCTVERVRTLEVVRHGAENAKLDPIWKIEFVPPRADVLRITIGVVPAGAQERVTWSPGNFGASEEDPRYLIRVVLDDDESWSEIFRVKRLLVDGEVMFHGIGMSPQEFFETPARAYREDVRCPSPSLR